MRIVEWATLTEMERRQTLARPASRVDAGLRDTVASIFADTEREGYAAVERWAMQIDRRAPKRVKLDAATLARAREVFAPEDLAALDLAADNIGRYHEATKPADTCVEIRSGVTCKQTWRPIACCGLYIPGGSAPLFSTLLMLAIPARVAGVPNIVVATPPNSAGEAEPAIIAAAALCGLAEIWLIGGAQAIAAMTFGAGPAKVQKLFGPGNAYVSEAKRYAAALPGGPQIDTPAGPSELMVIADDSARADLVAADLLSQAEHDADAQVLLVTTSADFAKQVQSELTRQLQSLPRADIAARSLDNACCILVENAEAAIDAANLYAPEHLSLQIAGAEALAQSARNVGAVFVGPWSAETFGDYVCGPSHVLPTDGAARAWSGVNVASFMKCVNVQTLSEGGARDLAAAAARLARLEGLEAHARAADLRGV